MYFSLVLHSIPVNVVCLVYIISRVDITVAGRDVLKFILSLVHYVLYIVLVHFLIPKTTTVNLEGQYQMQMYTS